MIVFILKFILIFFFISFVGFCIKVVKQIYLVKKTMAENRSFNDFGGRGPEQTTKRKSYASKGKDVEAEYRVIK